MSHMDGPVGPRGRFNDDYPGTTVPLGPQDDFGYRGPRRVPAPAGQPTQGQWRGGPPTQPGEPVKAPPASAQPSPTPTAPTNTTPSTPADQDAAQKRIEAQHARQQMFQLQMMEMQQRHQFDQWWVGTLSTINKAAHDGNTELSRKFG